jgi:hypothetical protein
MSDQNVLMNISEAPLYLNGFCDLKCDYSFYYQLSICTVIINSARTSIQFGYEPNTNGTKQVLYNGIEYNVSGVFIYSPSTHFFDGVQAEAEVQIVHQSVLGNGLPLVVCIPITTSTGPVPNNKGTRLLEDMIINAVNAINTSNYNIDELNNEEQSISNTESAIRSEISQIEGELPRTFVSRDNRQKSSLQNQLSTLQNQLTNIENYSSGLLNQPQILNITNYTLENIIPRGPFFSYTNTSDNAYYIVYGMNDAIYVDYDYIQQLQSIVTPFYTNPTYNDTIVGSNTSANIYPLFLNQTGATNLLTTNLSDEIYIDCQPTGSSNEQTNLTTSTSTTNEPPKASSVKFTIYVIFFLFVLFVIYMIFAYLTHPDKNNFSISSIKNPFT